MKSWMVVFLLAMTLPAMAGTREDVQAASARCGAIRDDRTWLDCYYGAVQPLRAQLGLAPATPGQIALVPPPPIGSPAAAAPATASLPARAVKAATPPKRQGWFSGLFEADSRNLVHLASYTFNSNRLFTVTLSDGEVLEQRSDDTAYAHWRGPAAGHTVSVTTSAFGGQTLQDEDDGSVYLVRKVR